MLLKRKKRINRPLIIKKIPVHFVLLSNIWTTNCIYFEVNKMNMALRSFISILKGLLHFSKNLNCLLFKEKYYDYLSASLKMLLLPLSFGIMVKHDTSQILFVFLPFLDRNRWLTTLNYLKRHINTTDNGCIIKSCANVSLFGLIQIGIDSVPTNIHAAWYGIQYKWIVLPFLWW